MLTNETDIPLALAVWLAADDYDYIHNPKYLSATSLLKPIKQIILGKRYNQEEGDVSALVPSSLGSTIHAGIEKAWIEGYGPALKRLGYSDKLISKIRVNPYQQDINAGLDIIPVYLERRNFKQINGWTIGGKFDMVMDGLLHDNKTTSAFTWIYGTRDEEYIKQCSIYRWLNPEIITEDYFRINFIFTDWSKANTFSNPNYPKQRIMYKDYKFMSLEDTEKMITEKIAQIELAEMLPDWELPDCPDDELWRKPTTFKYYSDPEKAKTGGRCSKSFTSNLEAIRYWKVDKKGKGTVVTVPGEVRRCLYCKCFNVCEQRKRYVIDGLEPDKS